MGQLFKEGSLTNQGVISPSGQFQTASSIPDMPDPTSGLDQQPTSTQSTLQRPSFLQAANQTNPATGMPVSPLQNPGLSKLGKLGVILMSGAQGALAGRAAQEQTIAQTGGRRAGGIGTGYEAAYNLPFIRAQQQQQVEQGQAQTQIAQSQAKMYPQIAALGAGKTIAETQKDIADASKAGAEANAVPAKTALDQAQANAAKYKETGGMLYDVSGGTPTPVAGQTAPLDADEAAILGKQPGEQVPMQIKNQVNEMKNRGIRAVQAGGRSLLVDNQGNKIKDMGASTPLVVMQNQLGAAGNPQSPEFQSVVDAVGQGKMDLQTAAGRMGRFPGAAFSLMGEVEKKYPNYFQGNYDSAKKVLENFTSGGYSQNLNAIETARQHMATFKQLAGDLNNGKVRAFNSLSNALGVQFGSDSATNLNIAKQFFSGEVGKAVVNGGGTAGERDKLGDAISTASSWTQLSGALSTADQLLAGKQKALKDTYESGRNATPNFGGGQPQPQPNTRMYNGIPYAQQSDGSWKKQAAQ